MYYIKNRYDLSKKLSKIYNDYISNVSNFDLIETKEFTVDDFDLNKIPAKYSNIFSHIKPFSCNYCWHSNVIKFKDYESAVVFYDLFGMVVSTQQQSYIYPVEALWLYIFNKKIYLQDLLEILLNTISMASSIIIKENLYVYAKINIDDMYSLYRIMFSNLDEIEIDSGKKLSSMNTPIIVMEIVNDVNSDLFKISALNTILKLRTGDKIIKQFRKETE